MPRIDASDLSRPLTINTDLGFPRGFDSVYEISSQIGKGGFGTVKLVTKRATGEEYACKILSKLLGAQKVTDRQQAQHLDTIRREVAVLGALRSTLNVVRLYGAYEDDENVYIVMEYCRGGELWHQIGLRPYSEETVARIMRAALRTIAQCHSKRILHRDVKPGNFMFLRSDENSPIKAVDFGLAVFFDPNDLPRRDLGFDGTPWFMAPEVLSSEVVPASDVWSAGVMAHQLLTGALPFDDRKNRKSPALSAVWKSILTDDVSFKKSYWMGVSEEAKDFVRSLLVKDPSRRPSAREVLKHPWVKKGGANQNSTSHLSSTIVQRIQRYGRSSVFKRTVLDMIANELVRAELHSPFNRTPDSSLPHTPRELVRQHSAKEGGGNRTWHNGSHMRSGSLPIAKGPDDSQQAHLLSSSYSALGSSWGRRYSQQDLTRLAAFSPEDWEQQRMASRLALDTSVHGNEDYPGLAKSELTAALLEDRFDDQMNEDSPPLTPRKSFEGKLFSAVYKDPVGMPFEQAMKAEFGEDQGQEEGGGRGQSHYKSFVEKQGGRVGTKVGSLDFPKAVSIASLLSPTGLKTGQLTRLLSGTNPEEAQKVLTHMNLTGKKSTSQDELHSGLQKLGYHVDNQELSSLIESMAPANDGQVNLSQFVASQMDWHLLQSDHREQWLDYARQAFKGFDRDGDGRITSQDLVQTIAQKLPEAEVELAVEQARMEACAEEFDLDFDGFVKMLKVDSCDNLAALEQYDSRLGLPPQHTGTLETVSEV